MLNVTYFKKKKNKSFIKKMKYYYTLTSSLANILSLLYYITPFSLP